MNTKLHKNTPKNLNRQYETIHTLSHAFILQKTREYGEQCKSKGSYATFCGLARACGMNKDGLNVGRVNSQSLQELRLKIVETWQEMGCKMYRNTAPKMTIVSPDVRRQILSNQGRREAYLSIASYDAPSAERYLKLVAGYIQ